MLGFTKKQEIMANIKEMEKTVSFLKKSKALVMILISILIHRFKQKANWPESIIA